MIESQQERITVDGQHWGTVSGDTLRKYVKKSKHLFRKWDAWGCDSYTWDRLASQGVNTIEVVDKEEKVLYTIDMTESDVWIDYERDFGYGMQYFVPRKYFTRHENFKG